MLSPVSSNAAQNVYTEYPDPSRDEWQTKVLPVLKAAPLLRLVKMTGMSLSQLKEIRAGRARPYPKNQEILTKVAQKLSTKNPERRKNGSQHAIQGPRT